MELSINEEFKQGLVQMGIDYAEVLRYAKLPRLLWEDTLKISNEEYFSLLTALDTLTTDQQLVQFSDITTMSLFVPPLFAAMCAVDGHGAISRLATFKSLIGPVSLEVEVEEEQTHVHFQFDYHEGTIPRFCIVNEQLLLISLLRTCTGCLIKPQDVECEYVIGAALESFIGCSAKVASRNSLTFSNQELNIPFKTKNNVMWKYLEPEFKHALEARQQKLCFSAHIREHLMMAIPRGSFSLADTAGFLTMSTRSIQRALQKEHTSYRNLVKEVQLDIAMMYLNKTSLSTEELGYLLGFDEVSSFRRAFKSWTGETISEFQKTQKTRNELL